MAYANKATGLASSAVGTDDQSGLPADMFGDLTEFKRNPVNDKTPWLPPFRLGMGLPGVNLTDARDLISPENPFDWTKKPDTPTTGPIQSQSAAAAGQPNSLPSNVTGAK